MRALLTLWNDDKELRVTKYVDCNKLIVSDGAKISIDGDERQLFNVVCSGDIIPHVAMIEIL